MTTSVQEALRNIIAERESLRRQVDILRSQLKGEDALHNEIEGTRAQLKAARALISDMKLNFAPGEPLRSRIEAELRKNQ